MLHAISPDHSGDPKRQRRNVPTCKPGDEQGSAARSIELREMMTSQSEGCPSDPQQQEEGRCATHDPAVVIHAAILSSRETGLAIPTIELLPNGSRLSCGALTKNSFPNLRAPSASSAC